MNQRELKFRAWDGKWMSGFRIDIDSTGRLPLPPNPAEGRPFKILMQFTGLLDKNGKDIYEGDIIKTKSRDEWDEEKEDTKPTYQNGTVVFRHDQYLVELPNGNLWDNGYSYEDWSQDVPWDESEIIGNIYENPELLQ